MMRGSTSSAVRSVGTNGPPLVFRLKELKAFSKTLPEHTHPLFLPTHESRRYSLSVFIISTLFWLSTSLRVGPARMLHELLAATTDMAVLPGVLGCSFDRLRTGSPCDVPFRYASEPTPCGCQVARPSNSRSLRSAQSRKRVPSFVISRQQFMQHPG